jgi:hypothetical protein
MIAKKKPIKKIVGGTRMTKKEISPELVAIRNEIKQKRKELKELKEKKKSLMTP